MLAIAACFLMAAAGVAALWFPPPAEIPPAPKGAIVASVAYGASDARRLPRPAPQAAPPRPGGAGSGSPAAGAGGGAGAPPGPPPPDPLAAYRGLGAWVDLYDYGHRDSMPVEAIVAELAGRGVRTLYIQTARWNDRDDIVNPGALDQFLELAHARGVRVVGWYLPGFADLDRDLRRSLAVIAHGSPSGHRFDGFAPDIEDPEAVGHNPGRFNAGIAEYSRLLREAVPPGTVLGAIVPDAKNNERAPGAWEGFPWGQIAERYDVVLPMAYWSVTKPKSCPPHDAAGYMREVAAKTEALMGVSKPMHLIGGIADCIGPHEVGAFVQASRELGAVGGSIYDFQTTHDNRGRDTIWGELVRLNG